MPTPSPKKAGLTFCLIVCVTTGLCLQPDTDTTLLLHFDTNLADVTGELPIIENGVVFESGMSGSAAYFTKSNSVYFSSANNILAESGTLEFLIKPRWNSNDGQSHNFLAWGFTGGFLFQKDGGNNLRIIANRFGASGLPEVGTGVSVANEWASNQWHHVAYTWSASSLKLYVDGSIRAQSIISNLPPISSSVALQIGADPFGNQADAVLDELRISSRERSAAEVVGSIVEDAPVSGLSIQPALKDLAVTETFTPSLVVTTMLGTLSAPASLATWSSANTNIAVVSSNGVITARNTGTTTLTATLKGQFAFLTLNVTPAAPPTGFRITQVWATTNGTLTLTYPSDTNCYYALYRGDFFGITNARALRMGEVGDGVFSDMIGAQASAFFRVRQLPISQPQDLDSDGIDDVYELTHPDSLNPLNASDASGHYLGNPKSNLEEYWQERGSNVFRILQVATRTNGTIEIQFPSDASCYYVLYRGNNPASVSTASDLRLGLQGVDVFSTPAGSNQTGFFRVRQVALSQPLDMDADGIDDVYELRRAEYLNPLVQADAAFHHNGNPKSNLEEYLAFQVFSDSLNLSGWKRRFSVGHDAWAIRDDGSLWSWGGRNYLPFPSAHNPTTFPVRFDLGQDWVALGGYSTSTNGVAGRLALKADGTAWLVEANNVAVPLDGNQGWKFISDDYNPVGVKLDGSLWSVKRPGLASTRVGTNSNWKTACQANASIVRIVAIKSDGSLWTLQNTAPERSTRLGSANNWISVVAGDNHCLAIDSNSRLVAWGYNSEGQLGDGTITDKDFYGAVDHGTGWLSADAQFNRSVGVKSDGTVWVWGSSWVYSGAVISSPTQVGTKNTWVEAKVGSWLESYVMAARSDGSLWAVGGVGVSLPKSDFFGQIGSNLPPVSEFLMIGTDNDWSKVSTSAYHSLATKKNGNLWGWGNHGFGSGGASLLPQKLDSENLWEEVNAKTENYRNYSIATKVGNTAWAWGSVLEIVAHNLTTTNVNAPWQISTNAWLPNRATQLSVGPHHTLKVDTNGQLLVWGTNFFGELGVNFSYVDATNPAYLSWGWSSVVAGTNFSMGIKTNGAMWGWGSMIEILGTTSTATVVSNPIPIDTRFGGPGEQSAFGFSAEVRNDGSLWTVGKPTSPATSYSGDGTFYDYDYPVPVVAYPPSKPFYLALGPQISGKLLVDANRDGKITDTDATYNVSPYRFWVNDDDDAMVDSSEQPFYTEIEEDDRDNLAGGNEDYLDNRIDGTRDLEDFSRLHIHLDGPLGAVRSGQLRVGLKWRNISTGNPKIKIYRAVESTQGGLRYLNDPIFAQAQTEGSIADSMGTVQPGTAFFFEPKVFESATDATGNFDLFLLFEGCAVGAGELVLTFSTDGVSTVGTEASVWLELKKVNELVERWTCGDGDLGDVLPLHLQTLSKEFPYPTQDSEKDYVLYVHGYNMKEFDKQRWIETTYKRLWQLGFKGRAGGFTWPCSQTAIPFDESEERAWQSATQLKVLLTDLKAKGFRVHLLAHSQGNIIASEALRLAGPNSHLLKTYVASQAAVPAHAFNPSAPLAPSPEAVTPNVYSRYWKPGNSIHLPETWPTGNESYLAPIYLFGSAELFVNFINPVDYALTGNSPSHPGWLLNQSVKRNGHPGYHYGPYGPPSPNVFFWKGDALSSKLLTFPEDRYEIFALIAGAKSQALGATKNIGGVFNLEFDLQTIGFSDHHRFHSGQFRSFMAYRVGYWQAFMNACNLSGY